MASRGWRYGQGPFGGDAIGRNPTDRGKRGAKRSLLVEADGGPLSVVVAGANVHDTKLLRATLDAVVVERPTPTSERPQHLCLDKGYDNPTGGRRSPRMRTRRLSGASGRRSSMPLVSSAIQPAAGWWSGRWPGGPSAGLSWCATTRRPATTWGCSNSLVACSGAVAGIGSAF